MEQPIQKKEMISHFHYIHNKNQSLEKCLGNQTLFPRVKPLQSHNDDDDDDEYSIEDIACF